MSTKLSISARMAALPRAAAGASLSLADSAHAVGATTYVASPTGSDPNNGTAPDIPIQSLGRASGLQLHPGDQVLLGAGRPAPIKKGHSGHHQLADHGGNAHHQHRGRHRQRARLD